LPTVRRVRLEIVGVVQGVFYRESARREAERLRVAGWIRNEPDASVTCEAQGSPESLQRFIDWCRRGPPFAEVEDVRLTELPPESASGGFAIRH
jgi:acylphosphatase